jgi:hypothetical protein
VSSEISSIAPQLYLFRAANAMKAVNSDTGLALSPGFSRQPKIEPGRDEEKKHAKNDVSKLDNESA